jgi:hypothetical protein
MVFTVMTFLSFQHIFRCQVEDVFLLLNRFFLVDFMFRVLCRTLYNTLNVPVHRDEEVQVQNSPSLICNALKPRKLDDEFRCAIAVFEPEDPSKHPMYCKNKVHNPILQ